LFEPVIGVFILANAICLGIAIDVELRKGSTLGLDILEHVFLMVFTVEFSLIIFVDGFTCLQNGWNMFDFLVILGGILSQWVLVPIMSAQGLEGHFIVQIPQQLLIFRMLRLLRVLRLLRLLKLCKPLYKLSIGILEAMHAMHWVLVFTAIILYACGILYRSVVGCGILLSGHHDDARELFSSVPQSMFHLFRLMNGLTPSDPLLSSLSLRLLYAFFLVISNWAVLSILTAVVCDNMIVSTLSHEQEEKQENLKLDKAQRKDRLKDIFSRLDKDQNGYLSECEFYALMANIDLADELHKASSLTFRDLHDLFNFLSVQGTDGKWRINCSDFIEKLQCEGKDVSERTLFRVEKQFKLLEQVVDRKFEQVRKCSKLSLTRTAPQGNRRRALTI